MRFPRKEVFSHPTGVFLWRKAVFLGRKRDFQGQVPILGEKMRDFLDHKSYFWNENA